MNKSCSVLKQHSSTLCDFFSFFHLHVHRFCKIKANQLIAHIACVLFFHLFILSLVKQTNTNLGLNRTVFLVDV